MDVLLKGEVYPVSLRVDTRGLFDVPHPRAPDTFDEHLLDVLVSKVEEVARVVPHETIALDGLAVAAHILLGLVDEVVGAIESGGERQVGYASAYDEKLGRNHEAARPVMPIESESARRQSRGALREDRAHSVARRKQARLGSRRGIYRPHA